MNLFGKSWSPSKTFILVCVLFHLAARINSMPSNNNEIEENDVVDDFQTSERGDGDDADVDEDNNDVKENLKNKESDDVDDADVNEDNNGVKKNLKIIESDSGDDTDFEENNKGVKENLKISESDDDGDTAFEEDNNGVKENLENSESDGGDDADVEEDNNGVKENLENSENDGSDDTHFIEDKNGLIENLQNSSIENQDEKYQNNIRRIESILEPLKRFNEFVANLDDKKEKAGVKADIRNSDARQEFQNAKFQIDISKLLHLDFFKKFINTENDSISNDDANEDVDSKRIKTTNDLLKSDLDIQDSLVDYNETVGDVNTTQADIRKKEVEDIIAEFVKVNEEIARYIQDTQARNVAGYNETFDDVNATQASLIAWQKKLQEDLMALIKTLSYHGTTPGRARWTKDNIQSALFEFNIEDIIAAAEIKKVELVLFKKPDPSDFIKPLHLGMEIYYGAGRKFWDGTFYFKKHKGEQRKNLMGLFTGVNPKVMNKKLLVWLRCLSCSHKTFTSVFGHRNEEGPYIDFEIKLSDGQKPKQLNHRNCNPEFECCKRDLEINLREVGMDVLGDHKHIIDYCLGNCDTYLNSHNQNSSDFQHMRMQYVSKDNNVPRRNYRRCCVPISYELVTVQLRTSKSDPYRTAKLDGMRVAECGCMW